MMRAFRERAPSILAATNLVGSGLDIPAADLIVITDADAFGESEIEQLIGRVGRRERPSDAVLMTGDDVREESLARDARRRTRDDLHAARHARQLASTSARRDAGARSGSHARRPAIPAAYDERRRRTRERARLLRRVQFFSGNPKTYRIGAIDAPALERFRARREEARIASRARSTRRI